MPKLSFHRSRFRPAVYKINTGAYEDKRSKVPQGYDLLTQDDSAQQRSEDRYQEVVNGHAAGGIFLSRILHTEKAAADSRII